MHHNDATVPPKPASGKKSRTGRPLLPEAALTFGFVDTLISTDEAIVKKKAVIQAYIDEYNALVRFRRQLRALSEMVAA